MREDRGNLERAHQPEPRHVGGRQRGDVAALVDDAAAGRPQELGQQVEAGGLAGPVRADQGMDGAARDAQVDPVHRDKAGKLLGQALGHEDEIVTHGLLQFGHIDGMAEGRPGKRTGRGGPTDVSPPSYSHTKVDRPAGTDSPITLTRVTDRTYDQLPPTLPRPSARRQLALRDGADRECGAPGSRRCRR